MRSHDEQVQFLFRCQADQFPYGSTVAEDAMCVQPFAAEMFDEFGHPLSIAAAFLIVGLSAVIGRHRAFDDVDQN